MTGEISFHYDPVAGLRTATYRGAVDDACLLAAYAGLKERPDFVPIAHDLADLRGVTDLGLTAQGLGELGRMYSGGDRSQVPRSLPGLAIVATGPLAFGMSRMFQLMNEHILAKQIRVFEDYDEALAWLRALPSAV